MIISYKCKETQNIWAGELSKKLPRSIQQIARRKLRILNNAKIITDLRIPPNNRLEALKGKRHGEHSIRINKQWRLCFKWQDGNAYNVKIEDYH
ncbi:MAG: type II toxin-antitoxin system RelE/ParE family toxin [Gammaproteobacteria bacterium]|nr:type II toxin-antitoxin system RelE/ParE family toxin [Gammaproteobacteria bacterium]